MPTLTLVLDYDGHLHHIQTLNLNADDECFYIEDNNHHLHIFDLGLLCDVTAIIGF